MKSKILVIDTSVLCCWLDIPGKETCGSNEDKWDCDRVKDIIQKETEQGAIIVLPLATIIETGNHIAQASSMRYECAKELAILINLAADNLTPWAAFSDQDSLWTSEELKRLALEWPKLALENISLGDATIKLVAEYYAKGGYEVEILTGDSGLKSYQPSTVIPEPRRRKR